VSVAARLRTPAVQCAIRDGVAWLTLDRPARGNVLDAALLGDLEEACTVAEHADQVRVVVLAARGRVFSSGLPRGCAWPEPSWPDGVGAVAHLTKPVVASLQGEAVGWGASLALACDLRVGTRGAALVLPEARAGRLPGGGATQRLARIVGPARALELVLLGRRLGAAEMRDWGLLGAVVPAARLAGTLATLAAALSRRGPLALRLAKEAVLRALDLPLDDGIRLEHDLYVLLQTTADRAEGVAAFRARRPPRFQGR
jgi:enoyl-CoA hydratase/carnithine racemase